MTISAIDLVGTVGDRTTQGLGRLIGQYVDCPKFVSLLTGIYSLGQDMEVLFNRLGRMLNVEDDIFYTPDGGLTYPENTRGASYQQLEIIAGLVGVERHLPDDVDLDDPEFRNLIKAKIHRNTCTPTMPNMRLALWWIFDPATAQLITDGRWDEIDEPVGLVTIDLEKMGVHVIVKYPTGGGNTHPTSQQLAMLHITSGRNRLPYGLLPRMDGTSISFQYQPSDVPSTGKVFCFSAVSAPTIPLDADGQGFNTTIESTDGTWARAFT